jgi:hypothetical protein
VPAPAGASAQAPNPSASVSAPPPMPPPPTPMPGAADDIIISKLERLAALKQQGILTEQEFLEQKARILRG